MTQPRPLRKRRVLADFVSAGTGHGSSPWIGLGRVYGLLLLLAAMGVFMVTFRGQAPRVLERVFQAPQQQGQGQDPGNERRDYLKTVRGGAFLDPADGVGFQETAGYARLLQAMKGQVVAGDLVSGQASGSPWSGPIPAWVALALAAPLVTILPWLSWLWKRSIDEHERISAFVAAEVAAFAYVIVLPVWWLLWRGGLLGAPDQIAIYVGFIMIYTAIWFYRKHN
jgi:hypothetical protein